MSGLLAGVTANPTRSLQLCGRLPKYFWNHFKHPHFILLDALSGDTFLSGKVDSNFRTKWTRLEEKLIDK